MTAPAPTPAAVPMDPRIRARRVEVIRSEGRRRLRILAVGLSVVGAVGAGVGATRSPLLDIDAIVVAGSTHTPRGELVAAAGIEPGMQMLDVDEAGVRAALQRLPWVRDAVVHKDWPGTVRVEVVERVPAAAVEAEPGAWALVDVDGRILSRTAEVPEGVVRITGAGDPGRPGATARGATAAAVDIAAGLPDELLAALPEVRLAGAELELRGPTGTVVRFGPADDGAAKVQALLALLAEVDLRRVRTIDVRVPSAPVLTRG